jgi:integrase
MTERKLPPGIRERHGKWQVRYYTSTGERLSETFDRLTDAKRFKRNVDTDRDRGMLIDPRKARTPFDEWAHVWFSSRHKLSDAKRARNRNILERHVIRGRDHGFGSMPVGRIEPLHVQEWVDFMAARYSPSYVRDAYTILGGILRDAVSKRLIGETPLHDIVLPEIKRKRERFLSEAEIERLVAAFEPFWRPLVFTAPWTGCRWGELAGLQRADLDLHGGRLHVRSVVTQQNVDGHLRDEVKQYPKSDASRRTIGLPVSVVDVLREHLDAIPEGNLVFTTPSGAMLNGHNFRERQWLPAVRAAGVTPLSFHDLRHTHVTLLIKYGWQEVQIVRRLGWSDSKMLHRVYGHLFPNHDAELVVDLDARRRAALDASNVVELRHGMRTNGDQMGTGLTPEANQRLENRP